MNWTIAGMQSNQTDIDKVYAEIVEVARWKTIIYCSEPEEDFDSYRPDTQKIKWVGGTVPACERRMKDRFVDYILPGKEASPNCDASSAATALAAGLAAMIVVCFEATQNGWKVRNPEAMDKLFISLRTKAKFVDVTGMFDKALSQADPVKAVVDECKRRIVLS
ncbi:hypothetical protein HD806DRAFT_234010 [Xylariaceae sp. AK1471]|nr:hypothetical protein HD806DRAFT_234010 [Xylariaceae sp. AK1471]